MMRVVNISFVFFFFFVVIGGNSAKASTWVPDAVVKVLCCSTFRVERMHSQYIQEDSAFEANKHYKKNAFLLSLMNMELFGCEEMTLPSLRLQHVCFYKYSFLLKSLISQLSFQLGSLFSHREKLFTFRFYYFSSIVSKYYVFSLRKIII